jgi:hypothetical protein
LTQSRAPSHYPNQAALMYEVRCFDERICAKLRSR